MTRAASGKRIEEVTLDAVLAGEVVVADVSVSAETLEQQARVAERNGNPQLASNLRRAGELVDFADERVLAIYEALRPGRSSGEELDELHRELLAHGAVLCADLVSEARDAYARRGLLK